MSMIRRFLREWKTLTPGEHFFALRRAWRLVVSFALIGALGALVFSLLQEPLYRARVQMVAAPNIATANAAEAGAGSNYVLQRARTYRKVVTGEEVAAAVIKRLNLPYKPDELASRVTVASESDTAVLTVDVLDPSPTRARDIANAIGVEFPAFVERLETPAGATVSPVTIKVVSPAVKPDGVAYPRTPLNVFLGLLVGLGIGVGYAVFRYAADPRIRGPRHASIVAGAPSLGSDFGSAVAALRRRTGAGGPTSIAVTGPVDDASRRTVTAELAVALARAGDTVVLVDADLRAPGLAPMFGAPEDVGLTTVLTDGMPVIEAAARWRHPEFPLFFLPAGPGVDALNLTEVRRSGRLAKAVQALQAADTVVVMAAPAPADLDPGLVTAAADAVILLARTGDPVDPLATAAELVRGTPVLGVLPLPPLAP
jgi:succinoglycan biosynthesis transport protein ExoP